ncbi:MAG: SRPBCC family protein [Polyangiales bacterium]
MASNEYEFQTKWRVEATPDEVFDILSQPEELPRWWPSVYLAVEELDLGDESGVGRVVRFHTKGWLPYTLDWTARVTEVDRPGRVRLAAYGDLEGEGHWTLTADGAFTDIVYDWKVSALKSLLRSGSFFARPVFERNHQWAMARGEESLKLEILRRRARNEAERRAVPAPPPPTADSSLAMLLGAVGAVSAVAAGAAVIWRRRPR